MILSFNLGIIMQHHVLGKAWQSAHLNTIRNNIIRQPACMLMHGRHFIIRLGQGLTELGDRLVMMRARILLLGQAPPCR